MKGGEERALNIEDRTSDRLRHGGDSSVRRRVSEVWQIRGGKR